MFLRSMFCPGEETTKNFINTVDVASCKLFNAAHVGNCYRTIVYQDKHWLLKKTAFSRRNSFTDGRMDLFVESLCDAGLT